MSRNLRIRPDRIAADIAALAAITEPDRPYTRRAFSPRFLQGRAWLAAAFAAAGLETRIDAAGNLLGRRQGTDPARGAIMLGSHSDTVPDGGRFDGIAGVVAALEVARSLAERGIPLAHDLLIADFLAEEVSIFGVSCIGSRGFSGQLPAAWLSRESEGRSLATALAEVGGDPEAVQALAMPKIAAFLELHIEQGPVLEAEGIDVGIVTAISGITRIELTFEGAPGHAGTTPMGRRADALVAAARFVTALEAAATALAAGSSHFAATVGEFRMAPNAANVIPGHVRLLVDARAEDRAVMQTFLAWLDGEVRRLDASGDVRVPAPRVLSDNPASPSDAGLVALLEQAADRVGASRRRIASGAGHDAAWIGRKAPACMLFVASRDGLSHASAEYTDNQAIALGTEVLLDATLALDARPTGGE